MTPRYPPHWCQWILSETNTGPVLGAHFSHGEHFVPIFSPLMAIHEASSLFSHFTEETLGDGVVTCFGQGDTASYASWI